MCLCFVSVSVSVYVSVYVSVSVSVSVCLCLCAYALLGLRDPQTHLPFGPVWCVCVSTCERGVRHCYHMQVLCVCVCV